MAISSRPRPCPRRQDRRPVAARLPPPARCPAGRGPRAESKIPVGIRDRAMLAVLAYSGCRVGELVQLRVRDYRTNGEHRILNVTGKGNKERTTPLHLEAVERLAAWLAIPGIGDDPAGPLFPARSIAARQRPRRLPPQADDHQGGRKADRPLRQSPRPRSQRHRAFAPRHRPDHRPRAGIGHHRLAGFRRARRPRTTLTYIRSRDRLSKSPAYVLKY